MYTKCDENACPVALTLSLLANKWSIRILYTLFMARGNVMRFNEMRRALETITQRELSRQLREFESAGIVIRTVHPVVPPMVEYTLTSLGKSLNEPIEGLSRWAETNGEKVKRNRLKKPKS
ncbi:MAG: helix-turn-helix transcriptional regulator [Alphaproteobacteria bacterium]|nr:helix-turn-helix transcriptional regulator [Alphaproteobacteria bacterium]